MRKSIYIPLIFLLLGLAAVSCSRKEDDELPARTGDLQVFFKISDQFGLLGDTLNIPVLVNLFADTAHAKLVRSEAVTAVNHLTKTVTFEDMEPTFFYLSIEINLPGLPPPCEDTRVFVQYNQLTLTDMIEMEVRAEEIRCR